MAEGFIVSVEDGDPVANVSSPPSDQNPSPITDPVLLHISFNQDSTCCSAATSHGFRIYTTDPFQEILRRDFSSASGGGGGVGFVGMLFGCKTVAVVGGGEFPQYPRNKVMIWDENQSRCIGDLSFRSEVVSVRLRRDRIVVVLLQRLFVYNLSDFKLVHQVDTFANPRGLCEVSQVPGPLVLACPGLQKGQVRVEQNRLKRIRFITAHDSRLSCIALTRDGCLLATSSTKGTLIRVFNTMDGSLLQEVRRGADRADVHSLAFSPTPGWLAASSEKGTIHIFRLSMDPSSPAPNDQSNGPCSNRSSALLSVPFIKGVLPKYFTSEWSVAQFRLHEGTRYVVSFGHRKDTLLVLGMDGSFYRCEFDGVKGGEMVQLENKNLFLD